MMIVFDNNDKCKKWLEKVFLRSVTTRAVEELAECREKDGLIAVKSTVDRFVDTLRATGKQDMFVYALLLMMDSPRSLLAMLRAGIHTCMVDCGTDDVDVYGDPVNIVAQMSRFTPLVVFSDRGIVFVYDATRDEVERLRGMAVRTNDTLMVPRQFVEITGGFVKSLIDDLKSVVGGRRGKHVGSVWVRGDVVVLDVMGTGLVLGLRRFLSLLQDVDVDASGIGGWLKDLIVESIPGAKTDMIRFDTTHYYMLLDVTSLRDRIAEATSTRVLRKMIAASRFVLHFTVQIAEDAGAVEMDAALTMLNPFYTRHVRLDWRRVLGATPDELASHISGRLGSILIQSIDDSVLAAVKIMDNILRESGYRITEEVVAGKKMTVYKNKRGGVYIRIIPPRSVHDHEIVFEAWIRILIPDRQTYEAYTYLGVFDDLPGDADILYAPNEEAVYVLLRGRIPVTSDRNAIEEKLRGLLETVDAVSNTVYKRAVDAEKLVLQKVKSGINLLPIPYERLFAVTAYLARYSLRLPGALFPGMTDQEIYKRIVTPTMKYMPGTSPYIDNKQGLNSILEGFVRVDGHGVVKLEYGSGSGFVQVPLHALVAQVYSCRDCGRLRRDVVRAVLKTIVESDKNSGFMYGYTRMLKRALYDDVVDDVYRDVVGEVLDETRAAALYDVFSVGDPVVKARRLVEDPEILSEYLKVIMASHVPLIDRELPVLRVLRRLLNGNGYYSLVEIVLGGLVPRFYIDTGVPGLGEVYFTGSSSDSGRVCVEGVGEIDVYKTRIGENLYVVYLRDAATGGKQYSDVFITRCSGECSVSALAERAVSEIQVLSARHDDMLEERRARVYSVRYTDRVPQRVYEFVEEGVVRVRGVTLESSILEWYRRESGVGVVVYGTGRSVFVPLQDGVVEVLEYASKYRDRVEGVAWHV